MRGQLVDLPKAMKVDELRKHIPNISQSAILRNLDTQATSLAIRRERPHSFLQEREKNREARQPVHRPRRKAADEADDAVFRVTVTLRVSDWHRRDGDGALATILDTAVLAGRRLCESDEGVARKGGSR